MSATTAISKAKKNIAGEFEDWRAGMLANKRRACMTKTAENLACLLGEQAWTRWQLDECAEQLKELIWILGYAPYLREEKES